MEEENEVELLQRYRRDRRILLNYLLSGSLIKKVVMPPGAVSLDDVDLDQVSVDFVLNSVKKGDMLELSDAIRDYHDSTGFPHINAGSGGEFFLATNPESSGSPPRRAPPVVPFVAPSPIMPDTSLPFEATEEDEPAMISKSQSNLGQVQDLTVDDIEDFEDDDDLEEINSLRYSRRTMSDTSDLVVGLPSFATGITDDDLRETAYEILLAAAGASGGLIVPSKEKKKEKKSRLLKKLGRSKSEQVTTQSQQSTGLTGLLEIMRIQMEISEAMDIRTRQGLLNGMTGKVGKRMDALLIPLELLSCVSRTEFSDKKAYIRWQKRQVSSFSLLALLPISVSFAYLTILGQLNMLEEGLVNHPVVGFGESGRKASEMRILLARIEESESFAPSVGELQRIECLRSLREIAIPLAERPARGDLTGEVCHWADGYHLNVRLYEKLLLSIFDVLDEGKLTEEIEEILELLKSTWRILGITETIHHTCYAWVLFRQAIGMVQGFDLHKKHIPISIAIILAVVLQFVMTREHALLRHAIEQLNKVPLKEERGPQERMHLKSLFCKVENEEGSQELTFLQSFLLPIQKWADKQLADYHLHFSEALAMMENVVSISMSARRLLLEEHVSAMQHAPVTDRDKIESYVSSSIKSAFVRTLQDVETMSNATDEHPMALLGEETKKLLKKDATIFMPVLSQWHPQAVVVSASLLHKLYGSKLVSSSTGLWMVSPMLIIASELLNMEIYNFIYWLNLQKPFLNSVEQLTEDVVLVFPAADSFEQYVMDLITSSCGEGEAEVSMKKLALYKIETISGTLVLRWVNSQLSRIMGWVERAIQQERWEPVSMQQRHGSSIVEVYRIVEETIDQFFALRIPMRSGEMNSLFRGIDNAFQVYAKHVVDNLASKEDIIPPVPILTRYRRESGIKAFVKKELTDPRLPDMRKSRDINVLRTPTLCVQLNTLYYGISHLNKLEDSIWERWTRKMKHGKYNKRSTDENLKKESFDGSRKDINAAIDRICEFTGTKIIFWDLREPFIENLYRSNVSESRLETLIEPLDVDGLLRVLLDGGPSRLFVSSDVKYLEEDLEVLKEFFISGGDGLPRGVVENQVARVRQVIKLQGYETRELIDDLKSASASDRSKLGADTKTLLRILCHRSDSEASQFLKKQYRIPKSAA
ncbi:Mammalian uncoordinated homology 13, domain 2 [Cynara cardunculus var. scolymus]|uniref:Mammalian uncoordinated homology 13, domain 2 n=1 Tax=Cynara cardunculus var. scolymus TaxID=59895 RepID=A0A118JRY8_CYNCS|nr:Mammalian uncoordinated homology 13, domain 2 [Cynara cardunculus var. scolymus]